MPSPESLQIELRCAKLAGAFFITAGTALGLTHLYNATQESTNNRLGSAGFALGYAFAVRAQFKAQRRVIAYADSKPQQHGSAYFYNQADQFWTYAKPLTVFALDGAFGPLSNPLFTVFGASQTAMCTMFAYSGKAYARKLQAAEQQNPPLR